VNSTKIQVINSLSFLTETMPCVGLSATGHSMRIFWFDQRPVHVGSFSKRSVTGTVFLPILPIRLFCQYHSTFASPTPIHLSQTPYDLSSWEGRYTRNTANNFPRVVLWL